MINFVTGVEYQGSNIDKLNGLGTEFCTFIQAINHFKLTGKELKGAKSCAKLFKMVDKNEIKNGKVIKKKVPNSFNVFEKNHLLSVLKANGVSI
jgi:hypothetical protein